MLATKNLRRKNLVLFKAIMIWTIITSLFSWLPLVRIVGKPKAYFWGILWFSGEGSNGPFWIFIISSVFVIFLLYSAYRLQNRKTFYLALLLWQLVICFVLLAGVKSFGAEGTLQGEGLHWEIPMWIGFFPAFIFLLLTLIWIYLDYKEPHFLLQKWSRTNTYYLISSLLLLGVALALFNAGTNYNWVTGAAIITTIVHWLFMVESFKSLN
ncbi:MAG: hypothetical protein AAF717_17315 [Bacteroidota bacterium]